MPRDKGIQPGVVKTPDELRAQTARMREIAQQYRGDPGAERILEIAAELDARAAALERQVKREPPH